MIWPIAAGLFAGALWALAFIAPGLTQQSGAADLTIVRYAVFGGSSALVLATMKCDTWLPTLRDHWRRIFILALMGNTIYYLCLSEALRRAGTLLPTMIIGTLPIVMAVLGGLRTRSFSFRRLLIPSSLVLGGILLQYGGPFIRVSSLAAAEISASGVILALAALASWSFYGLQNAEFLSSEKDINIVAWTALIGVATAITLAPVAMFLPFRLLDVLRGSSDGGVDLIFWGTVLGLLSSWLATWFWNVASRSLAGDVLGYLVVSETVFGIGYAFLLQQRFPEIHEVICVALLISGVVLGIRAVMRTSANMAQ